jgi:hypothetical protein
MRAITDKGGPILEAKLVGYATAGRAAVKRKRPGWVILTVDVLAVLTAVGLVHGINAIFFRPAPVETAAANEPKLMPLSTVPGANFARIPSAASMAELAREARTVVSGIPDDAVLFARAALFAESPHRAPRFTQTAALQPPTSFGGPAAVILPSGPFGNGGSSPAAPGGGAGGTPGGGGIGGTPGGTPGQPDPPPVAEPNPEPPQAPPAPPEPTLLVYVPTPQPVNPVVENLVAPSVDAVDDIVEEATGPPLDLTPRLGLGVDLGVAPRADGGSAIRVELSASGNGSSGERAESTGSGSGSESETASAGASSSDASGTGAGTGSGTSAAPATLTSSVTNTVTGTVNSTLSALSGLLR